MRYSGTIILAAAAAILAGCGGSDSEEDAPSAPVAAEASSTEVASAPELDPIQVEEGRDIAVSKCGGCHAVDDADQSPRPDAPPMKSLLAGYNPEALADDLIDGVKLGHQDMPEFDFTVIATDALVTYLMSIFEPIGDD
jgi:mono/diheme cytochrome c family protein